MNKQLALAIKINDEATLEDFNWSANILLKQQIDYMLTLNTDKFLYLWGAVGSGKSHILQGICQSIPRDLSGIYLPLKMLKPWGPQAIEGLEDQDLICIDDIDEISGDAVWEEALFHLYNRVKDAERGVLVISGLTPPPQLPIVLPDLKSRLSWGLVFQLNELDDETKINTLRLHAAKRGFELPELVGQFLLSRCSRNMHDLFDALNRLDEASLAAHRKITIPFVKTILAV